MKKTRMLLLLLVMVLVSTSIASAEYPVHLNGDRNYILCDGHHGIGYYVVADSLNSEVYNPPYYQISINVIAVPDADRGKTEIRHVDRRTYGYYWNEKKMYLNGHYLNPNGSRADGATKIRAGEIAFELAYNIQFGAR